MYLILFFLLQVAQCSCYFFEVIINVLTNDLLIIMASVDAYNTDFDKYNLNVYYKWLNITMFVYIF